MLLLGLVTLFLALSLLSYSRDADFYRSYGVHDPLVMNADEIVRYVGIPFQAAMAVSNHVSKAARRTGERGRRCTRIPVADLRGQERPRLGLPR